MSLNEAVVIDIVDHPASCSSYILSCRVFAAAALPFVSKASLTDFCNVDDDSVGEITSMHANIHPPFMDWHQLVKVTAIQIFE